MIFVYSTSSSLCKVYLKLYNTDLGREYMCRINFTHRTYTFVHIAWLQQGKISLSILKQVAMPFLCLLVLFYKKLCVGTGGLKLSESSINQSM